MDLAPDADASPASRATLAQRASEQLVRAGAFARSHALAVTIAAVCAGVLVWQTRGYRPFFADDSFIALRYVWRLLHGRGLTWTDGERVEGYSDLLWVLLVAAGGLFSKELIGVSRTTGILTTVLAVLAVVYAYRPRRLGDAVPALVGGLAMVLTSPVVAWSIGGLEQPLLGALVAWATVLSYRLADGLADDRTAPGVGVLLGLAAITRPDGALFTVTTCAGLLLAAGFNRRNLKAAGRILAMAGLFFFGQLIFRRFYYDAWVPNTAHVKLALTTARLSQGWQYVAGAEPYLRSLVLMALVATVVAMTRQDSRKRMAIPIASAVAWTSYVVVIGGDISPARRHLVVIIVLLSLVTAEGLHTLARRGWASRAGAGALAAISLVTLARAQSKDPEKRHALNDTWVWSGREVGRFLSRAFAAEKPLVAVDAAGALPYFAPQLPCLDMLGLNDRALATHHPPEFGNGLIGHELGNGAYILGRKPDLIAFHTALGDVEATWRGGREMRESPEFARRYQLVTFKTPEDVTTRLWVRTEDGRIGVKRAGGEVSIPGYLFYTQPGGVAELNPEGRLGLRIDASHPAYLFGLALESGRWEARVEASGEVNVNIPGAGWPAGDDGTSHAEFRLEQGGQALVTMAITLRRGDRAHLLRVVFRRIPT